MPESKSSSSGSDDSGDIALGIAPRIIKCAADLQRTADTLRQRNAALEADAVVPWPAHQEMLRSAIRVLQHEAKRLMHIVDEAPSAQSLAAKTGGKS